MQLGKSEGWLIDRSDLLNHPMMRLTQDSVIRLQLGVVRELVNAVSDREHCRVFVVIARPEGVTDRVRSRMTNQRVPLGEKGLLVTLS